MPYRDFKLPDGRVVRTRISPQATLDWFDEREVLLRKGYPDRPPDLDTETTRMWCGPNDDSIQPNGITSFPIGYYVLNLGAGLPTVKIMIGYLSPGDGYHLRLKMESGIRETIGDNLLDFEDVFPFGQEDSLNYRIEYAVAGLAELEQVSAMFGGNPEWMITGPKDIEDMNIEQEQAVEEYKQEFGDSEKDHPYWQRFRQPAPGGSEGTVH